MTRLIAAVVACLLVSSAPALQEYRYIEGEAYTKTDGSGLREEGFTSWMRHPSAAKVMVLAGNGWLEYDVRGLGPGPYHVLVRALSWTHGTETDVLWDGQKVGRIKFAVHGTALMWSLDVGTVRGPGDHTLRLVADPGITQAPYIDVILLTTQPDFAPDNEDRDFVSYRTALPLLQLTAAEGVARIAPDPAAQDPAASEAEVSSVAAEYLGIGSNELVVGLEGTPGKTVRVSARLGAAAAAEVPATLAANGGAEVRIPCEAETPGATRLSLQVAEAGQELLAGSYTVTVPNPVALSLDEYAYAVGTPEAVWHVKLTTRAEVTKQLAAEVALVQARTNAALASYSLPALGQEAQQQVSIRDLPRGRYAVRTTVLRNGKPMLQDERQITIYDPAPPEAWAPVQKTEARGDTVLMNGKPFLGRLLYHAAADAKARAHGFNMVQCYGGDPDPRESIGKHLDACVQAGVYGTVALFNNAYFRPGDHFDLEHIRLAVERFRDHPATWAWDLVDEPEPSMPPQNVAAAADLIRKLDPNHVVWVNLCQPDKGLDYLQSQDLWSFDYYPIPGQKPFAAMVWIKISDEHLRGKRPIGSVLQTYSSPGSRMPTPDELRCMAYLHLIHGYKWLGFYSYYDGPPSGCLARCPELWSYTRALNSELTALAPVILADGPMTPLHSDQSPELLQAAEKTVAGKRYLFVVSNSDTELAFSLQVQGKFAQLRFEESRLVPIRDGRLRDTVVPFGARVYEME